MPPPHSIRLLRSIGVPRPTYLIIGQEPRTRDVVVTGESRGDGTLPSPEDGGGDGGGEGSDVVGGGGEDGGVAERQDKSNVKSVNPSESNNDRSKALAAVSMSVWVGAMLSWSGSSYSGRGMVAASAWAASMISLMVSRKTRHIQSKRRLALETTDHNYTMHNWLGCLYQGNQLRSYVTRRCV